MANIRDLDDTLEGPKDANITVEEAVIVAGRKYQLEWVTIKRSAKIFAVKATVFDADGSPLETVVAQASGATLTAILTDNALTGEDWEDHTTRIAIDLLKGKGKIDPAATKI